MGSKKYPQPYSLGKYYDPDADLDRIHNGIKKNGDGDPFEKYKSFLRRLPLIRNKERRHRLRLHRSP